MTGDCHVRFSESARVKFPRATQLGKEKGKEYYHYGAGQGISGSWECRDCVILDDDEYFPKLRETLAREDELREKDLDVPF